MAPRRVRVLRHGIVIMILLVRLIFGVNENDENNEGQEGSSNKESNMKALEDEIHEEIINKLADPDYERKLPHRYTNKERVIFNNIKKGLKLTEVYNPVTKTKSIQLVDTENKIVPKESSVNSIIEFYYNMDKSEGANKLHYRIRQMFRGISRRKIQNWPFILKKRD